MLYDWLTERPLALIALAYFCLLSAICATVFVWMIRPLIARALGHSVRDPLEWSFWICAFANNQFEVAHALGDGDVYKSSFALALQEEACREVVAIIDESCTIYKRIWCAFELFFAKVVMPNDDRFKRRKIRVSLINESGLISDGDGLSKAITDLDLMIDQVHTADAECTSPADKDMITTAMTDKGTKFDDLDTQLKEIAKEGLSAVKIRRRAPMMLFVLTPIAATTFSTGLAAAVFSIRNSLDKNFIPMAIHWTDYALSWWAVVGMLASVISGICCRRFFTWAGGLKDVGLQTILFWRMVGLFVVISSPVLVHTFVCLGFGRRLPVLRGTFMLAFLTHFAATILGIPFGLLYVWIREKPVNKRLRQYVEDVLLS